MPLFGRVGYRFHNWYEKFKSGDFSILHLYLVERQIFGPSFCKSKLIDTMDRKDTSCNKTVKKTIEHPTKHLFLWALLSGHFRQARCYYLESKAGLCYSIVAIQVLQFLIKNSMVQISSYIMHMVKNEINYYSETAVKILNYCSDVNRQKTQATVIRKRSEWGSLSLLDIALLAQLKEIISHDVIQDLFRRVWWDHLSESNSHLKLLISGLLPIIIPYTIQFKDKSVQDFIATQAWSDRDEYDLGSSTGNDRDLVALGSNMGMVRETEHHLGPEASKCKYDYNYFSPDYSQTDLNHQSSHKWSFFKKMKMFYYSPIIIFIMNCFSQFLLKILFAVILLTSYCCAPNNFEIFLLFWVTTIFLEEFRQCFLKDEYLAYQQERELQQQEGIEQFDTTGRGRKQKQDQIQNSKLTVAKKIKEYWSDIWNRIDITFCCLFYGGFLVRVYPSSKFLLPFNQEKQSLATFKILQNDCPKYIDNPFLKWGQISYSICFVLLCMRTMHSFTIHKHLGPMILIVWGMVKDLMVFAILLLVFFISFAVTASGLLYPNEDNLVKALSGIVSIGYWKLYGELNIDEIVYTEEVHHRPDKLHGSYSHEHNHVHNDSKQHNLDHFEESHINEHLAGTTSLSHTAHTDPDNEVCSVRGRCPQHHWVVTGLLMIYVLITNILLVNLLVATFTSTFDKIKSASDVIWKYQKYELIKEYQDRPILPPPFIFLWQVWQGFKFLKKWFIRKFRTFFCGRSRERTSGTGRFTRTFSMGFITKIVFLIGLKSLVSALS